jgi:MYND finger
MTRTETNKSMKETRAKRLKAWYDLGKDVELVGREPLLNPPMHSDRTGRSNREDRHVCWWSECARRTGDKTASKELLRCAGCKKARYCSRECQTKDWKEQHKATCKSMKGA